MNDEKKTDLVARSVMNWNKPEMSHWLCGDGSHAENYDWMPCETIWEAWPVLKAINDRDRPLRDPFMAPVRHFRGFSGLPSKKSRGISSKFLHTIG
jgi:hypothetical protein